MPPVIISALRVIGGPATGATIVVDRELVIGREGRPGGVSLAADEELSRHHARFQPLPNGAVMVEDLGSVNGTLVNGERIAIPRLLALGDEILLGATTMRLARVGQDPRGAPAGAGVPAGGRELETLPPPAASPSAAAPGVSSWGRASSGRVGPDGTRRRVAVVVAALAVTAAVAFAAGHAVARPAPPGSPPDEATAVGTVYVESGASQPGANAVIAYQYRAGGDLQPLDVTAYPTGGAGGFDLTNTGALDSDGQVVLNAGHTLLFAVNQGSDSVAVFHVRAGGALAAVAGSPFASGGRAPAGLAVFGNRLVVVNKAQDGVRDLASVAPTVASFLVRSDGSLRPSASVITAPPGSSPTEALISPDGKVVVVPEEHGPFLSLTLGADATLTAAPGSPYSLPDSIFPRGYPSTERWALGLAALPGARLSGAGPSAAGLSGAGVLYGQAVDSAQLVVYRFDDSGRLTFVRAVADPGAYLPCWTLVNAAGTRLYTDNAGNNTMSVFDLSDPLNPRQLQVVTLKDAGNPWDLRMDPTGRYVFVLDPRDRQDLVTPGQGNELHTLVVNSDGTLTEPAYSPVPIPVPLNTNPIGLAVAGH